MTDDGSAETGVAEAEGIAGDDPEEGETGVTDLQESDRPNENRTSRKQDNVLPFFISTFLSPDFELIQCFRDTKTLTSTPCFIKGTFNSVLLFVCVLNDRNGQLTHNGMLPKKETEMEFMALPPYPFLVKLGRNSELQSLSFYAFFYFHQCRSIHPIFGALVFL
jgi:hypothetical protein